MPAQTTTNTTKTLIAVQRELEVFMGSAPVNNAITTLNHKYSLYANEVPVGYPTLKYFGIGVRGNYNVDDGNLTAPHQVLNTNMDLYTPIPFRVVPVEQDLTPIERSLYRMRVVQLIKGVQYACYYLKVMEVVDSSVKFTKKDPLTGVETDYTIDSSNLTPTPPQPNINGTVTSAVEQINVSVGVRMNVTGAEVTEAVNIFYDGDMRRAKISEFGMYMGQDKVVVAKDHTDTDFTYTEAIFAQLALHHTNNGIDLSPVDSQYTFRARIGKDDIIIA